jgi:hypothetical protein
VLLVESTPRAKAKVPRLAAAQQAAQGLLADLPWPWQPRTIRCRIGIQGNSGELSNVGSSILRPPLPVNNGFDMAGFAIDWSGSGGLFAGDIRSEGGLTIDTLEGPYGGLASRPTRLADSLLGCGPILYGPPGSRGRRPCA